MPRVGTPKISVVIVAYDMPPQIARTLRSFAATYQRGVGADDYEVIVVDNGSPTPIQSDFVRAFGPNFRCLRVENPRPSPVGAINEGAAQSRGEILGLVLDGARLATPGLLKYANLAFSMHEDPTVATLAWHLGPAPQQDSYLTGFDSEVEKRLLAGISWRPTASAAK